MGITAYSTPPKLSEYKEPISEELMMKGTMMDAQRIEQADQEIQNTYSQLKGIPSLPGADEERKKQILSGIQEQVKGMSYNDLRNPSTANQIKGYIQQVSNNPDLLAIAARGQKYNQDMTTYQALTAKGKQVSPWNMAGLNEAQEYINKNLFIRDKRFSNGVQEDPEINKAMMDAMKDVDEEESTTMSGGRYVTTKTRPLDKLNQIGLGLIANTPQINQDFQRKFEYSTKGTDWEGLGTEHYQQGIQAATSVINNPHSSAIDKQNAQRDLKEFQAALQSPTIGDLYKQEEYDKEIKNYVQNISLGLNSYGKVEKQTEVAIYSQNRALDYQLDQMKAMEDLQIESGLSPQAYVTPQGTFDKNRYIKEAQEKIQKNQLELAQGRQDIKDESKNKLRSKLNEKMYIGSGDVKIEHSVAAWIAGIKGGDEKILKEALTGAFPDEFDPTEDITTTANKVRFSTPGGGYRIFTKDEILNKLGLKSLAAEAEADDEFDKFMKENNLQ